MVLFLAYGLNDIKAASGDAQLFGAAYRRVLEELKESLPDTKIYVNSILPVTKEVVEEDGLYGNIPDYNRKLMDTEDGIHMASEYYGEWVNHMAEAAEL